MFASIHRFVMLSPMLARRFHSGLRPWSRCVGFGPFRLARCHAGICVGVGIIRIRLIAGYYITLISINLLTLLALVTVTHDASHHVALIFCRKKPKIAEHNVLGYRIWLPTYRACSCEFNYSSTRAILYQ